MGSDRRVEFHWDDQKGKDKCGLGKSCTSALCPSFPYVSSVTSEFKNHETCQKYHTTAGLSSFKCH